MLDRVNVTKLEYYNRLKTSEECFEFLCDTPNSRKSDWPEFHKIKFMIARCPLCDIGSCCYFIVDGKLVACPLERNKACLKWTINDFGRKERLNIYKALLNERLKYIEWEENDGEDNNG